MTWHRTDDDWPDHPRLEHASAGDVALWHALIAYSSKNLTDGVIARNALKRVRFYTQNRTQNLLRFGLLTRTQNGAYALREYDQYQDSKATVQAKRAQWRERQQQHRSRRDTKRDSRDTPTPNLTGTTKNLDVSRNRSSRAEGTASEDQPKNGHKPTLPSALAKILDEKISASLTDDQTALVGRAWFCSTELRHSLASVEAADNPAAMLVSISQRIIKGAA